MIKPRKFKRRRIHRDMNERRVIFPFFENRYIVRTTIAIMERYSNISVLNSYLLQFCITFCIKFILLEIFLL